MSENRYQLVVDNQISYTDANTILSLNPIAFEGNEFVNTQDNLHTKNYNVEEFDITEMDLTDDYVTVFEKSYTNICKCVVNMSLIISTDVVNMSMDDKIIILANDREYVFDLLAQKNNGVSCILTLLSTEYKETFDVVIKIKGVGHMKSLSNIIVTI